MPVSECPWTRDRIGELALGVLDGDERADVIAHLEQCPVCRVDAARDAATVDALVHFVPSVPPPAGFATRTLERIETERDLAPRRRRQWQLLAAACALVAATVITSVAVVRILDARQEAAPAPRVTSAAMIGDGGARAGQAFLAGDRYLVASLDYAVPNGRYRVETVANGRVRRVGALQVRDGRGVWAGHAGNLDAIEIVRMVGANGRTVCEARFGPSITQSE